MVRIYPTEAGEKEETSPQYDTMPPLPGTPERRPWQSYFAGLFTRKGEF
jgi:hypothetical protein